MRAFRKPLRLVALAACTLALACAPRVADACGGFFSRRALEEGRRPSLAYEQALIVFDEEKQREHFIREIVFRRSSEAFGFVVPVPSRPEVAKVAKSPFPALRSSFPYEPPDVGSGSGLGRLGGIGTGAGVKVLEVTRVGSFTAFVLAADDPGALTRWLGENGLETTKEAAPWLAHHVARRFFFVAMRYEPPAARVVSIGTAGPTAPPPETTAETVRISFDTPLPFYPYFEPDAPEAPEGSAAEPRLLEVWLVAKGQLAPVAARRVGDTTTWVRPMEEGRLFAPASRERLVDALGASAALLGPGELTVQRFMDQKRTRRGFGDVVFVPKSPQPADAARRARLRRLASTVDPSLLPSLVAPPGPAHAPAAAPTAGHGR